MTLEDIRRSLLLAIASSVGCGPSIEFPDNEEDASSRGEDTANPTTGGVTTLSTSGMSGNGGSPPMSGGGEVDGGVDDGDDGDDGADGDGMLPKLDVSPLPDFPQPDRCPPQPVPPAETCDADPPNLPEGYHQFYCVNLPEDGDCHAWAEAFNAQYPRPTDGMIFDCLLEDSCFGPILSEVTCGPLEEYEDQCCFWFGAYHTQICPGRPFVVGATERLATVTTRIDWAADTPAKTDPSSRSLTAHERAALASVWAEQALFEHASIASFSRFIMQLLACGAPAHLIASAHTALGEELEHARLFFGFASGYKCETVGPTALKIRDGLQHADDFDTIVLSAVREGCIAETISAWHVAEAARAAKDETMATALAQVADQELEHAMLAWRFVAWALPHADALLRQRIVQTFQQAELAAPRGPNLPKSVADAIWLAHGILPAQIHARSTRQALIELVAPAAQTLLATGTPAQLNHPQPTT